MSNYKYKINSGSNNSKTGPVSSTQLQSNSSNKDPRYDTAHIKVPPHQLKFKKPSNIEQYTDIQTIQNQQKTQQNPRNLKSNRDYSMTNLMSNNQSKHFATSSSGVEEKDQNPFVYYNNNSQNNSTKINKTNTNLNLKKNFSLQNSQNQNQMINNSQKLTSNVRSSNNSTTSNRILNNHSNLQFNNSTLNSNNSAVSQKTYSNQFQKHKSNNSDVTLMQNSQYFENNTKNIVDYKLGISKNENNQQQSPTKKTKSKFNSLTHGSDLSDGAAAKDANNIIKNNSRNFLSKYQSEKQDKKQVKINHKEIEQKSSGIPFFSCFQNSNEQQTEAMVDNPPFIEFMVKDKDTNQVYDIRSIDQMQQLEGGSNKKEYFEKLKKRHTSIWQSWWNQKKDHNQKLLLAVRQNDYFNAQMMLDPSLGDLKADQNIKDENGWSPLHFAAFNGNFDMIVLLLKHDSDIDSENNNGQNALIVAAQKGHVTIIQVLLNYGADINHQDMHFNTALHYACLFEKIDVIDALLQKPSIQIKLKNNDRKTAKDIANSKQAKQHFEVFVQRQNQIVVNASKVTIQEVSNESMFNLFEQDNPNQHQRNSEHSRLSQGSNNQHMNMLQNQQTYSSDQQSDVIKNDSQLFQQQQFSSAGQSQAISNNYKIQQQQQKLSMNKKQFTPFSTNSGTYYQSGQTTAYSSPKKSYGPDRFKIMNLIGRGSFGEVYLVQDKEDGKQYAMKVLHKSKILGQNLVKYAMTERNVLSITSHPFIIKLRFAFQNDKVLFLIMDFASGGDMAKLINQHEKLTENATRVYLAEILTALETLHSHDIIYRDLKPENIVIDGDGHAMLTDFGLSKEGVHDHKSAKSFCGSLAYLAPEMLRRQGHGKAVDWYHFGVLLYEMLTGNPPFVSHSRDDIINNIQTSEVKLPNYLSNESKSLIKQLMHKNPVQRLGSGQRDALEIKQHPFFHGIDWKLLQERKIPAPKKQPDEPILENRFAIPQDLQWENMQKHDNNNNYIQGWSFIHPDDTKNPATTEKNNNNNINITNSNINNISKTNQDYNTEITTNASTNFNKSNLKSTSSTYGKFNNKNGFNQNNSTSSKTLINKSRLNNHNGNQYGNEINKYQTYSHNFYKPHK